METSNVIFSPETRIYRGFPTFWHTIEIFGTKLLFYLCYCQTKDKLDFRYKGFLFSVKEMKHGNFYVPFHSVVHPEGKSWAPRKLSSLCQRQYSLLLLPNSLYNDCNAFLASCELSLADERPALFMAAISFRFPFVPFNRDEIWVKLLLNCAGSNSTCTTAKSRNFEP